MRERPNNLLYPWFYPPQLYEIDTHYFHGHLGFLLIYEFHCLTPKIRISTKCRLSATRTIFPFYTAFPPSTALLIIGPDRDFPALYPPQVSGTLLYTPHRGCQDFNNRKIYIIQIIIFPLTHLFCAINTSRQSVSVPPSPSIWNSHSRPWSWQVIHTWGFRPQVFHMVQNYLFFKEHYLFITL